MGKIRKIEKKFFSSDSHRIAGISFASKRILIKELLLLFFIISLIFSTGCLNINQEENTNESIQIACQKPLIATIRQTQAPDTIQDSPVSKAPPPRPTYSIRDDPFLEYPNASPECYRNQGRVFTDKDVYILGETITFGFESINGTFSGTVSEPWILEWRDRSYWYQLKLFGGNEQFITYNPGIRKVFQWDTSEPGFSDEFRYGDSVGFTPVPGRYRVGFLLQECIAKKEFEILPEPGSLMAYPPIEGAYVYVIPNPDGSSFHKGDLITFGIVNEGNETLWVRDSSWRLERNPFSGFIPVSSGSRECDRIALPPGSYMVHTWDTGTEPNTSGRGDWTYSGTPITENQNLRFIIRVERTDGTWQDVWYSFPVLGPETSRENYARGTS